MTGQDESVSPLRICVLTGRTDIADWMLAGLDRAVGDANAEIPLVVHATDPDSDDDTAAESDTEHRLERYARAGAGLAKDFIKRDPQTYTAVSDVEFLATAEKIRCETKPADGLGVVIPENVVERVADTCDVVVHFEVGILQGAILTRPTHGVLSFHHGDIRAYRGSPAGFWEFLNDEPTGGATLQRLTPELDAGYIVAFEPVDITDAHTWTEIRRRLFAASPAVLETGIRRLHDPSFEPESVPEDELGTLYYTSQLTPRVQARYLLKEVRGLLKR